MTLYLRSFFFIGIPHRSSFKLHSSGTVWSRHHHHRHHRRHRRRRHRCRRHRCRRRRRLLLS